MQWTAPTRRHLGTKMSLMLRSGLSPLMAKTRRQSHLRSTSGMAPTPDLLAAMSGFRLIPSGLHSGPDVAGATGIRRVLTPSRHSDSPALCGPRLPERRRTPFRLAAAQLAPPCVTFGPTVLTDNFW